MIKKVPHILHLADELLRNRKFEEALTELGGVDIKSISPDEKAFYDLILVEVSLFLGDYKSCDILGDVLLFYRDSTDNNKFARAKFLQGWLYTSIGKYSDAKEVLTESYVYYKRCDHPRGQARALNRLGYVACTMGDIASSISYLQKCIEIYNNTDDEQNKVPIMLNLAQLLFASGNITDSIAQYKTSRQAILSQGNVITCTFYYMSAIPHALKGNIDKAKENIKKTTEYFGNYPREQAIYYENLGWIHLLEEDYANAEIALKKGLKISLKIAPESALVSQIKRRLADAYFGLHKYDRAKKYADEALVVAEKINERVEIAACYRIFAQLERKESKEESAREWFKKAIDLFDMIGSRYELATTRYLAAMSGVYHNGERQALLFMAREYFESEDVKNYVEKINNEIKRTRTIMMPRPDHPDGESPKIVTVNHKMKHLIDLAENVASSNMSVLLMGPTGTGKDLFARFIHHQSGRKGRFIAVNSAAIPDSMTEAELFGHRKGSFTGAGYDKQGLIEVAEGGTLYLNEIAESSPEFQTKLLDVLENKKIRRLGETRERKVDFRLIAATNHDLEELIRDGKFRADLYHRLKEIPITLPSLAERAEDIPVLLEHFLHLSGVTLEGKGRPAEIGRLAKVLSSYEWPGNIREFKAEVERLALIAKGDIVHMAEIAAFNNDSEAGQLLTLLERTHWNRSQVAKILGITEGTVRHRIKKYNLANDTNL